MKILASKIAPYQHAGTQVATQRLERVAMVICLALIGVAGAYFAVLYLVSQ
jgi:hypothetical protein